MKEAFSHLKEASYCLVGFIFIELTGMLQKTVHSFVVRDPTGKTPDLVLDYFSNCFVSGVLCIATTILVISGLYSIWHLILFVKETYKFLKR